MQYCLWWLISWFTIPSAAELMVITLYARKFGHVFFYGIQFFLWFRAIQGYWDMERRSAALYALGFCLILAMVDEGRQSFYPSRGASLWDVSLDMGGAGLAALFTLGFWNPKFSEQEPRSSKTRLL
jgi:VanZ family protein